MILETDKDILPLDWSLDGKYLLFVKGDYQVRGSGDLWVLPMTGGDRKPFPFLATPFEEVDGVFSPDGRYVAYTSNESGREEVYVARFQPPGTGGGASQRRGQTAAPEWQISTGGGSLPRWRRDGREIYYRKADNATVVAVPLSLGGDTVTIGTERPILRAYQAWEYWSYDVTPDGSRFVVNSLGEDSSKPIAVVLDWPATLKKP